MSVLNLESLFRPKSVAVVGASRNPERVGSVVMRNLLAAGFGGPVLPINPKYESVGGVVAYQSLSGLPVIPELAVVCTPPATVPGVISELAGIGTRAAVVITAGLSRERDQQGRPIREAMMESVGNSGLRILGPNCVGLISPHVGLNASFAQSNATPGKIAFVSQSGALCTAALGWASTRGIGFSAFVSLGNSEDVDCGDVVDFLGSDPHTRAILLYIESLKNARKFLSAARAASRNKPVVAIKAGRVSEGEAAAASHTGALAGSDEVYDYALRRAGVLRVDRIDELFAAAETIARLGTPSSDTLTILTNGGGPGVMATDALIRGGGQLAKLSADTGERLRRVLPSNWSHGNPIDIIGDANEDRYREAVSVACSSPEVDTLLVIHSPTAVVSSVAAARAVATACKGTSKPVLTCWLGGGPSTPAQQVFDQAGVAHYDTPEDAVQAFLHMNEYRKSSELLMQTPPSAPTELRGDGRRAREVIQQSITRGESWLNEVDSKEVLRAHGIPTVETRRVSNAEDAADAAEQIGFPVALKILSPDALHKSDVGGVALDLETRDAVLEAAQAMATRLSTLKPGARLVGYSVQAMAGRPGSYEVIVGGAVDPIFGPFVMFGHGGTGVEVLQDTAVALPPLNMLLASELVSRTRVSRLLRGFRSHAPVNLEELYLLLIRVSRMLAELPELVDLDINPVLVDEDGVMAVDARMRVQPAQGPGESRLAIRPYPKELEEDASLRSGRKVLLRPIRPEDEPSHRRLFQKFTPEDFRFRFSDLVPGLPHSELSRYTQIDYDREMAFIALDASVDEPRDELGVVRGVCDPNNIEAEFAIIVAPETKGEGLGRLLLEKLVRYLRARGIQTVVGSVHGENRAMLALARSLGFRERRDPETGVVDVRLDLRSDTAPKG